MNVQKLIGALSALPPNTQVYFYNGEWCPVNFVVYDGESKVFLEEIVSREQYRKVKHGRK